MKKKEIEELAEDIWWEYDNEHGIKGLIIYNEELKQHIIQLKKALKEITKIPSGYDGKAQYNSEIYAPCASCFMKDGIARTVLKEMRNESN